MFPTREIWGSKDKTLNMLSICLLQNLNQLILLFCAIKKVKKMKVLFAQSCLTLCNTMDYSPSGSSFHRILQAKILEWVAIPLSRESSWPRYRIQVSCNAGRFFTIWLTRERVNLLLPSAKSSIFLFTTSLVSANILGKMLFLTLIILDY